jgi:hypothetical protein
MLALDLEAISLPMRLLSLRSIMSPTIRASRVQTRYLSHSDGMTKLDR